MRYESEFEKVLFLFTIVCVKKREHCEYDEKLYLINFKLYYYCI